ncbi:hypothetical protein Taro_055224 [Colocasia esculenta]|uniref:Uncharacterized protein n=1 Tax=Colocasia esculenta TaxID=4460 RepID=A0A843XSA8_COLES|nr:hypothetical protein [Colocasia esculenta]
MLRLGVCEGEGEDVATGRMRGRSAKLRGNGRMAIHTIFIENWRADIGRRNTMIMPLRFSKQEVEAAASDGHRPHA